MFNLPKTKQPATRIDPKLLLLYGPPKLGKTTLLSQLENNLIIDIEQGSEYIEALKIEINSLTDLFQLGTQIIKEGRPYKYISIDTITKLEDWCEEAATKMYINSTVGKNFKGNSVLELANGGGYLWLRMAFNQAFEFIQTLPSKALIIVCHVRDKMLVDNKGVEISGGGLSSQNLELSGKIKAITCGKVSSMGLLRREVIGAENGIPISKIYVNFMSGIEILCGSRPTHLQNMNEEFSWDKIFIEEN